MENHQAIYSKYGWHLKEKLKFSLLGSCCGKRLHYILRIHECYRCTVELSIQRRHQTENKLI
jgi:hypothetical protein